MNEKRKILHIATFQGNIGDNASHIGLNKILETIIPIPFDLIRHEIRDYYKNVDYKVRKFFDRSFVSYVNTFDLVIIGGGGFLDYFVEDSVTGTTFDISIELLDEIKTPILFSSVGCVPNNIVPDGNVHKFEVFLKYLLLF